MFAVWFSGPDDPNLAVLHVAAEEVEYWDSPFSTIGRLVGFVKALATGDDAGLGTHKRVQLDTRSTDASGTTNPEKVYGEGNYAASREYNRATRAFVPVGPGRGSSRCGSTRRREGGCRAARGRSAREKSCKGRGSGDRAARARPPVGSDPLPDAVGSPSA